MWAIKFRLDNYKSSWYVQSAVQFVASTTPDRSTAQVASVVVVVVVALSRCNCVRVCVCVCEKLSLSHFRRVSCRLGVVGHISTTSSFMGFWRKTAACGVLYFDFLSFFKGCKCLGRSGFPHVVSEREREKSKKRETFCVRGIVPFPWKTQPSSHLTSVLIPSGKKKNSFYFFALLDSLYGLVLAHTDRPRKKNHPSVMYLLPDHLVLSLPVSVDGCSGRIAWTHHLY